MTTRRSKPTHPGLARPAARGLERPRRGAVREGPPPGSAPTAGGTSDADLAFADAGDDGWPEESPTFPTRPEDVQAPATSDGGAEPTSDGGAEPTSDGGAEPTSDTVPPAAPPDDGLSLAGDEDDGDDKLDASTSPPKAVTAPPEADPPWGGSSSPAPDGEPEPSDIEDARDLSRAHLRGLLEALVFASDKPITSGELARMASAPLKHVKAALADLRATYAHRGIVLDEVAGGWSFRTHVQFGPFVRELTSERPVKLSRAQVETLAIVAYRQPITRPEIDDIRGVDSGATLKLLLERDLVRILGKKDEPGRPILYGTTAQFLEFFGLKSLKDLPTLREFTELSEDSRRVAESELGEVFGAAMPDASEAPRAASPEPMAPEVTTPEADAPDATMPEAEGDGRHDTVVPDAPSTGQELEDPPDIP